MKLIFCNIGWMKNYNGIDDDFIERGGSYNKNAIGHEVCNFSDVDGVTYGYVRSSGKVKIEKLGASKSDEFIDGVTVVWTATAEAGGTVIIGWYRNARIYREEQYFEDTPLIQRKNSIPFFRVNAYAKDVILLPIKKRSFLIPRAVKGGIGQSNVWYADSMESQKIVTAVQEFVESWSDVESCPDVDQDVYGFEGNPRFLLHLTRERDSRVINEKKADTLKKEGKLACEVCGFDFFRNYGLLGKEFCEVHHLIPLHKADGMIKTKLSDLAVVCSNCHRMIHRSKKLLSIEGLRGIINDQK